MENDRKRPMGSNADTSQVEAKLPAQTEDSSFVLLRDNLIEAIRILVLRRWSFFVPFCVVACIATVASHWIPRSYRSTTLIERRDHPVLMNLRQTAATGDFAGFFRPTLEWDLTSRDAMAEVAERAGLIPNLTRNPDGTLTEESLQRCAVVANNLISGVTTRFVERTDHFDQIQINFTSPDPTVPQRVVNEIKNTYILRTRAKLTEMLTDGKNYFDGEAAKQRDRIAVLEGDILSFQAEYIGIDPTNPGALKLKLTSLETEQSELGREIAALEREVDSRDRLIATYNERAAAARRRAQQNLRGPQDETVVVPMALKSSETQALEGEIQSLEQSIHDLKLERRMTDLHPDILERRDRISRLQERLKQQYLADAKANVAGQSASDELAKSLPANRGVSLDDIQAADMLDPANEPNMEVAAMQMSLQDRVGRLEAARSRLRFIDEDLAKHQSLESNVYKYRKEYKLKSDLLAQTRSDYNENTKRSTEIANILAADESERGFSFTELTPPTACVSPIKPRGSTILMLALLAGLAAGAVTVLLKELFDQTYHTTKQVTRSLGVAILETVDEIVTSVDRARRFRQRVFYSPAIVTLTLGAVTLSCAAAYLSLEQPNTFERAMRVPTSLWQRITDQHLVALESSDDLDAPPIVPLPQPATETSTPDREAVEVEEATNLDDGIVSAEFEPDIDEDDSY